MGVAATLFAVQQIKRIEQRRSGAAQWLPGPRLIGQNKFPFRTIKIIIIINLLFFSIHKGRNKRKKYIETERDEEILGK